jgi:UPF0271 protein
MQASTLTTTTVDLNADMGEGMPTDADLLPCISSANIACGYHAGSHATMVATVQQCMQQGVAVGAHPSFLDRAHFGRKPMQVQPRQLQAWLHDQLGSMQAVCKYSGATLHHVKLHGALYNMAATDEALATVVLEVLEQRCPEAYVYGLAGSLFLQMAAARGLAVVHEFFADRTYTPQGTLTPRSQANACLHTEAEVWSQVQSIFVAGYIPVHGSSPIAVQQLTGQAPVSLCIHGDGPHAVAFARLIFQSLQKQRRIAAPITTA